MVLCVCSSSLSRCALQGEVRSRARAHRASQPQGQNVSGHRVCTAETARRGMPDGKVFTSPSRPWTAARLPLRWRPRHSSASLHNSLVARRKTALLPGDSTFTEHLRTCPVGGVALGDGGAGGAERGQGGQAGCVWWSDGGGLLPSLTRKYTPRRPRLEGMTNRALVSPAGPGPSEPTRPNSCKGGPCHLCEQPSTSHPGGGKGPICLHAHAENQREEHTRGERPSRRM